MQIYGLFLNWLSFLEKKLFHRENCWTAIKMLYFRSFKSKVCIIRALTCNVLIFK